MAEDISAAFDPISLHTSNLLDAQKLNGHKAARIALESLLVLPENARCADCNDESPSWASVNNRVFICTACSGVHRSLGVDISFVQSCKLDLWTMDNVIKMQDGVSNEEINSTYFEYSVPPDALKPNKYSDRAEREIYIHRKYIQREFIPSNGKVRSQPKSSTATVSDAVKTGKSIGEIQFVGIITVHLLSASNLINADIIGKSDSYAILTLGKQSLKSKVLSNNLNPVFNEKFTFSWNGTDVLRLELWDEDMTNDDDPLGWTVVNLQERQIQHDVPLNLNLKLNDVKHGDVQISVVFNDLSL